MVVVHICYILATVYFAYMTYMAVSSSTDVFHLSVVQDCRLAPGRHQRENHKVRHTMHTEVIRNLALCL